MKTSNDQVSAPSSAAKAMVLARVSARQTIIVAMIGLISAVGVALIANMDKISRSKNSDREELGYYEAKSDSVQLGFSRVEVELQSRIEIAQQDGKSEIANELKGLANEVRNGHARFQQLHATHIEAIDKGQRLKASKIKSEANELIWNLDNALLANLASPVFKQSDKEINSPLSKRLAKASVFQFHVHGYNVRAIQPIPLYGKRTLDTRPETCQLDERDKLITADSTQEAVLP